MSDLFAMRTVNKICFLAYDNRPVYSLVAVKMLYKLEILKIIYSFIGKRNCNCSEIKNLFRQKFNGQ